MKKQHILLLIFLVAHITVESYAQPLRVAINGFGRIGRAFLRAVMTDVNARSAIRVVAINSRAKPDMIGYLFAHDTTRGKYPGTVAVEDDHLIVDGVAIKIFAESDPRDLPWHSYNIDWVVESTGKFTRREDAQQHIDAGAKKVLIAAPAKREDITIILGVNDQQYNQAQHKIVSLGSCTTNALAPMVKVLHNAFGIQEGFFNTIHAITNSQALLDANRADPRRSRSSMLNTIPTTSGAADIIGRVVPELAGKIRGGAVRVADANASLLEFYFVPQRFPEVRQVVALFTQAAQGNMHGILDVTHEQLVSSDFRGNSHSITIDCSLIQCGEHMIRVFGWYDNEWGYSMRLKDFLLKVAR